MSIEIAQKYGVGVTYKGEDGGLYFKDEAGNVTNLTQPDQLVKVSSNDTTAGYLEGKLVAGTNITLTTNSEGANETITIDAAGGGAAGSYAEYYDVTLADCENTSAETTILSATIPGGTWADGDAVAVDLGWDLLSYSGATAYVYANFGMTGVNYGVDMTNVIYNSSGSRRGYIRVFAVRSGSNVYFVGKFLSDTGETEQFPGFGDITSLTSSGWMSNNGSMPKVAATTNFDNDVTVFIKYQWTNGAHPNRWLRPWHGSVVKTGKGAAS